MSGRVVTVPVLVSAVLTAVVSSALAIVVNLATEWKGNMWAWIGVAALTLLAAGVAAVVQRGRDYPGVGGDLPVIQTVQGSVIGRDNIQIGRANDIGIHGIGR